MFKTKDYTKETSVNGIYIFLVVTIFHMDVNIEKGYSNLDLNLFPQQ